MKKLWSNHSYTILLILVCSFSAIFLNGNSDIKEDDYVKVTVKAGDTVWEIADQYSLESELSKKQFVKWVLSKNDLIENKIYPGEEIILPVKNRPTTTKTELASAFGE